MTSSSQDTDRSQPLRDGVPFPSINKLRLFLLSAVDDDGDRIADEEGELASRRASALGRTASKLGRIPLPLLCRRRRRASSGSLGERPLTRAKRFSTSVKLQTPERWPDMPWPGSEPAATGCVVLSAVPGAGGCVARRGVVGACVKVALGGRLVCGMECGEGEGGTLAVGDGASTIHIRWLRVAQSLATVWARVE